MLGLLPFAGGRAKGLNPRTQCNPSMGGSCCVFKAERSCRPDVEFVSCATENVVSVKIMHRSNNFIFMITLLGGPEERYGGTGFVNVIPLSAGNYPSKQNVSQCEIGAGSTS